MSEFKITGPGFYRTRNGSKAYVAGPAVGGWRFVGMGNDNRFYEELWFADGCRVAGAETPDDLIAPWTEPETGTAWINVYRTHFDAYTSREYADKWAQDRIACVSVNWTEGDGL